MWVEPGNGWCPDSLSRRPGSLNKLPAHRYFKSIRPLELLNDAVAFTCGLFELLAIQNPHCASCLVDDLFPLQVRSCQANARSVGSEHGRKEIVSGGQVSGINSVVGHQ